MRRTLAVTLCLLGTGCGAGWGRVPQAELADIAPRQQVQVWSRGRVLQWQAVRLTVDSISGVPFTQDRNCDSCRVGIARAAVDSVKLGDPEATFFAGFGAVLLGSLLLLILAGWGAGGFPST